MERYLAKITSLLLEPAGRPASLCKIFIAKPTVEKELAVGKLFGFAEITQPQAGGAELVNRLLEQLKNDLYQTAPQRQPPGPPAPADFGEQFNDLLQQSNTALMQLFETGRVKIRLDDCNLLVCNLRQQELAIAAIGKVTGYLFHYRASRDYQVITITEPNLGAGLNPLRLFSQSITGTVGPLDYAFFCTESILDYLSLHTVSTMVTQNAGPEAVRQLKQALAKANPKVTAAAIMVSLVLQRPPAAATTLNLKTFDYAGAAAKDSMRTLHQNQQRTSQLLSPRLVPSGRNISRWLRETLHAYGERVGRMTAKKQRPKPQDNGEPSTAVTAIKKNFSVPTRAAGVVWAGAWRQISGLARRLGQNPVSRALAGVLRSVWQRFRRLSTKRQLAIAGSLVLAGLLGYNLVALQSRHAIVAREKAFAAVLEQAEHKRDAAREALIYQDEGGSRLRLNEGLHVLTQLPENYRAHPTVVRLQRELTTLLNELRHEIVIADPLQLANFANLDHQGRAAAVLVKLGDRLYTQNIRTKELFTLNLTSRAIATVQPSPSLPSNIRSATNVGTSAVLLDGERRLLRLTASEQVRPLAVSVPVGSIIAAASFRDRLYLLDTASGTVFRTDPAGGGYGAPRNWIADPSIDLRTGVDLALDGDLYALRSDGQLVKLRQGRIAEFTLQPIDPPLSGPTKLKTSEGSGFIYLLDPPTKRVVVISKNGELVRQYRAAAFDELLDFVVDEAGQTLYLLNGTRIYGVPMEHLPE